ncbi:hypothetical protein [[Ruminococcus] torques]|jgi:hypothetical protein|uniref:hypothetical protein n=1 Tax=[Ruminococcus] torques TaxID=33039 RepID=UPI00265D1CAD|nr:hypothetical protein [[Ruminococcus] torques]
MIFLKRRAFMTFKFNYETSKGIKQVILTNCGQAPFKRFSILGNSHQDSTTGKQLFDVSALKNISGFSVDEDGFIMQKVYNTTSPKTLKELIPSIEAGKSYYLSVDNPDDFTGFFGFTGSVSAWHKNQTFVPKEDDLNIRPGIVSKVGGNARYRLMITEGQTASPYEPYTGGKPSPSHDYPQQIKNVGKWNEEKQKYEVDVRVTGKNLFDKDSVQLNVEFGDANSDFISMKDGWFVSDFIPVFSGKTYFISGKKTGYGYKLYDIDKHFIKNIQLTHGRLSVEDGINYVRINGEMKDLKNIQVELGTTATSYEPYYKEQTATITMDEPLRGIGKYQDKITKDGIARRIRSVMLNGNEDWKLYGSNGNINNFGYILREAISNNVGQRSSLTFSSYKSGVWATDRLGQDMFARIIRINLPKDVFPDVETLRNWLSQSKTTLQYVLEKEVIVPISQSEQDAIRALTTYHPTTVITVDGGDVDAGIEVEYAVKNKEKI